MPKQRNYWVAATIHTKRNALPLQDFDLLCFVPEASEDNHVIF